MTQRGLGRAMIRLKSEGVLIVQAFPLYIAHASRRICQTVDSGVDFYN